MDRRRPRVAGVPGTMWIGKNVHISRGGDIERPKKFVPTYALPTDVTLGLAAVRGQLYTFGSRVVSPSQPNGVLYQQLVSPDGSNMTQVLDARPVDGKLYVIARFASGHVYHFYDGTRVTDWDAVATANSSFSILADYMAEQINTGTAVTAAASGQVITITAVRPGTGFTISKSTTDGGGTNDQDITLATVTANAAGASETRATGTVTITGTGGNDTDTVTDVTANGVSLMYAGAGGASTNTVAANVAIQINNKTAAHGYSASAFSNIVTITAPPNTGATPNGYVVAVTAAGVTSTTSNMAGGVIVTGVQQQVVTATFSGTFEVADIFTITINGVAYVATGLAAGSGTSIFVYKKRVWSPAGSLWEYSQLNDFDDFSDTNVASGAGFINVSNESEGTERLVGAEVYSSQAAVFSRRNCQIYNLSTDAEENAIAQPLKNTGALAHRSILAHGNTDVFYLDETGIRSLRAKEVSNEAYVGDIGVAIDPFIQAHIDALPNGTIQRACSAIEPREGRFMMALGERVYVLSSFPASQISAWTYYEPGINITEFTRVYRRLYARAGEVIYEYGGADGSTYPSAGEMIADVTLPYVSTNPPAKDLLTGFNLAASGEWSVKVYTDPNNENAYVNGGIIRGTTYNFEDLGLKGQTAFCSLRLTCAAAGAASISNATIYHTGKEQSE